MGKTKMKPELRVETDAERVERWKRRAERRQRQRQQDVAHMRAARTKKHKDAARARRAVAAPTPAMLSRRAKAAAVATQRAFEKWLASERVLAYLMTPTGSGRYGLVWGLRTHLDELIPELKNEHKT